MLPEQQNKQPVALDSQQLSNLQQLSNSLTPLQLAWASGYLAAKSEQPSNSIAVESSAIANVLTILYASQTGNAKGVANKLASAAENAGITVKCLNVADYKPKALKSESHLLIVTSTNGEGEAPDDALSFHEFLLSKKAPKLPQLSYGVLALGDSSYEFFCQTGKDFDKRLTELGAKAVVERVDCDVDYQEAAETWINEAVAKLKDELTSVSSVNSVVSAGVGENNESSIYTKENPFSAELLVCQKITGRDSGKDVRHIEIDLSGSNLRYQPGDALGVWFENDETLVNEIIDAVGFSADDKVTVSGNESTLHQALVSTLDITQTAANFVTFWAEASQQESLLSLVADKAKLRDFASQHQVIDIIKSAPLTSQNITAQQFVDSLRHITPRLYSIASSQAEVDEEVHLTVGVVQFEEHGQTRFGGASGFLTQRLQEGDKVKVFIEHNHNFKLPENNETPIIMVGPGTGVAPFRAFMQQRDALAADGEKVGESWMFFGDQTFTQDFLYQVEWQNYLKSGVLTKMEVAFSRDQAEKVYVQHRLKQHSAEVFEWLQKGAHLYICGDANKMAKDVHQTLVDIVMEQGELSEQQAESYLKSLRSNKRYQRDVY